MAVWVGTSGDLVADRRLAYAEGLANAGDLSAAIEVLSGALERVPGWAAGWFRLGEWHAAMGDSNAAAEAWEAAVRADPADVLGAGLKRDLARAATAGGAMPAAFVETLFDQYAERFDAALVERLDYRVPGLLAGAIDRVCPGRRFAHAMDLGCGTGLMGAAIRDRVDRLAGVDISAAMLAQAQAKGLYERLDKADLGALPVEARAYDLILAADVFAYLGGLEQILGWCAASLAPGGLVAFSVEAGEGARPVLRESRRFAHSPAYLAEVLAAAGLPVLAMQPAVLRKDRGEDIHGLVVLAAAPDAALPRK